MSRANFSSDSESGSMVIIGLRIRIDDHHQSPSSDRWSSSESAIRIDGHHRDFIDLIRSPMILSVRISPEIDFCHIWRFKWPYLGFFAIFSDFRDFRFVSFQKTVQKTTHPLSEMTRISVTYGETI